MGRNRRPRESQKLDKATKMGGDFCEHIPVQTYLRAPLTCLESIGCGFLHLHLARVIFHRRSCYPKDLGKLWNHKFCSQPDQLQCFCARLRVRSSVSEPTVRDIRPIKAAAARQPFLSHLQYGGRIQQEYRRADCVPLPVWTWR